MAALILALVLGTISGTSSAAENKTTLPEDTAIATPSLDTVLNGLEHRYDTPSFSARFHQESPLPDIQITERAEGKAFFKRPGKFRWSYDTPEVLEYISDGEHLWIYSPVDNNVWIGNPGDFFGKGGSASVLTDIKQIRTRFTPSLADSTDKTSFRIKLVPKESSAGINDIYLSIDRTTYDILTIVSVNMNGEETRIMFSDMNFDPLTDDSLFSFTVPENAIIIPLD